MTARSFRNPLRAAALGLLLVVGSASLTSAQQITAQDVVARCAQAMGGTAGADAIRNLRFLLRPQDPTRNIYWEIQRPNKVRKERPEALILVFDGSRAAFLLGPAREDGSLEGPHLIPAEDWHHFEMDIALYFPAFFDYPAEYMGTDVVGGAQAHLLKVMLPMGAEVRYSVDAESFLPLKVTLPSWEYTVYLGDYEEVDGITYFRSFWSSPDRTGLTLLDEVAFNLELDQARFALPADIRD